MPISHLNVTMSCRTCIRAGVLGVLGQECKYDRVSELRDSSGAAEGQLGFLCFSHNRHAHTLHNVPCLPFGSISVCGAGCARSCAALRNPRPHLSRAFGLTVRVLALSYTGGVGIRQSSRTRERAAGAG